MIDIEVVVARRLSAATGIPAFLEMPEGKDDPGELLTIERTGGGGGFLEPVAIDVDCWAGRKQRKRALAIANAVKAAVVDLDEDPCVFGPKVVNVYRSNDPDTRRSRYVVQMELWVCE